MNKKIFTFISVIILLITGVCSAALVGQLSNTTSTVVIISPPEFYIGSAAEETLLINEKISHCACFEIKNVYRTFKAKELGGIDFNYTPEVSFSVRAKVATTTPQDLILNWGYYDTTDTDESNPNYLCSATTTLSNSLEDKIIHGNCNNKKPADVKRFFYEFEKDCSGCGYTISKCAGGFYTKIELNK